MKKVQWLFMCLCVVSIANAQSDDKQSIKVKSGLNSFKNFEVEVVYKKSVDKIKDEESAAKNRFLIKRKKDDNVVEEAPVDKKATNITTIKKVAISSKENRADVSKKVYAFDNVDKIPLFSACKTETELKKCFNSEVTNYIQNNFVYPTKAIEKGITGKVAVKFVINKNGKVTNIRVSDPNQNKILSTYSKKLVSNLPTFIPASKEGNTVPVSYEIYLNYSL